MEPFGPAKRRVLVRILVRFGFSEPSGTGKHKIMRKGDITIVVPNLHQGDIGRNLLSRILKQAGITRDEWEKL